MDVLWKIVFYPDRLGPPEKGRAILWAGMRNFPLLLRCYGHSSIVVELNKPCLPGSCMEIINGNH